MDEGLNAFAHHSTISLLPEYLGAFKRSSVLLARPGATERVHGLGY